MMAEIEKEIKNLIEAAFREAVSRKLIPGVDLPPIHLEIPRDKAHGDLASNIAMRLAPRLRRSPAEIAALLIPLFGPLLEETKLISRVEADPRQGFLNFTLSPRALRWTLKQILTAVGSWGESKAGEGEKVLLEFVSANPTGPLTVAHGRQAAVGDALGNLLKKAGFEVCREYYLNDRGRQMEILGASVYLRWRELKGEKVDYPQDYYQGNYITKLAKEIPSDPRDMIRDGEIGPLSEIKEADAIRYCARFAARNLLATIREELNSFGVHMDSWVSERELVDSGKVVELLKALKEKKSTYEKDGALWFRSSAFGDEKDRVLKKSSGELTYLASDIAYHQGKFERGFGQLIDFWGPDHHGYVARLKGAMKALGFDSESLDIIIVQLTTLYDGKKQLSMSTRAGEFISLRQVMDEVGKDATRYFFVRRRKESHLDFDLALAKKKSLENPVYYVQYAHARINSIFKKFEERCGEKPPDPRAADLEKLTNPEEMEIIKKMLQFPQLVENAARSFQPHLIPSYLEELAGLFHSYYNRHRVILRNRSLTDARLALVTAVQSVLAEGLELLGVTAPESM